MGLNKKLRYFIYAQPPKRIRVK